MYSEERRLPLTFVPVASAFTPHPRAPVIARRKRFLYFPNFQQPSAVLLLDWLHRPPALPPSRYYDHFSSESKLFFAEELDETRFCLSLPLLFLFFVSSSF